MPIAQPASPRRRVTWAKLGERIRLMLQRLNDGILLREDDLCALVWPDPVSRQVRAERFTRWQADSISRPCQTPLGRATSSGGAARSCPPSSAPSKPSASAPVNSGTPGTHAGSCPTVARSGSGTTWRAARARYDRGIWRRRGGGLSNPRRSGCGACRSVAKYREVVGLVCESL